MSVKLKTYTIGYGFLVKRYNPWLLDYLIYKIY